MLAHSVFFSLHDNSPAAIKKLVNACKKYLPAVSYTHLTLPTTERV